MRRALPLLLALAAAAAAPLRAQGWIEIERPRVPERLNPNIVRVSSEVRTTIEGRIARVEVEERFRNTGGGLAEGSYLYPLPGEAVFQNFSLWMGEQELRGEMMNAEQARGIYEEIVRRQKDPALLTLAGHGLVRAQVFPIQPGETRKVVLRYTQLLDRAGDALRLRYALGARGVQSGSWRLTLPDEAAYGTPYSPTHQLTTTRVNGRLEIGIDTKDGGDIELLLPLRRGLVGTSVLTHAPGGEDGYLMLLLAPPEREEGPVVPRDLSLVVDVSGSMSGDKLDQAKAALRQALGTLRPEDRFRLVAFSSGVRNFRDGFTPATRANLDDARTFVDALAADGGTNISGALDAVLGSAVASDRLQLIIFLTDGVPSVGEQNPDRIAAVAAGRIGRARVFTVGVGHDVNTYLLDRLAREGRGAAEYVAPEANVEVAVGNLVAKLRRPALVNLRIVESPVEFRTLSPAALPDLFYGEELVIFGRYHGTGGGPVVIEGERNGRRERFTAEASFPPVSPSNDFIPRLWASRRIGDLTRQIRLEGSSDALIREVRDLGLRYGILTEYTSYLVQEPGQIARRNEDMLDVAGNAPRPMAAPAPAAQTGKVAFDRARESGQLSQATSLREADAAAEMKLEALGSSAGGLRRVGGHVFRLDSGVWTDIAHADTLRVTTVAPFSPAYFALIRALPELAASLQMEGPVLVAGRRASLRITAGGIERMSDADLRDFVRNFRGTA
ncbi:MAG TPA: VIT domain-containing protein [Gemmatimonadales bacterium]|nr:VIT domain-containing protein [Gemmatimonadales bacterium]